MDTQEEKTGVGKTAEEITEASVPTNETDEINNETNEPANESGGTANEPAENPAAKLSNTEVGNIVHSIIQRAKEYMPATMEEGGETDEEQVIPVPMTASELSAVQSAGERCTAIGNMTLMLEHEKQARVARLDLSAMSDEEIAKEAAFGGVVGSEILGFDMPVTNPAQEEAARRLRQRVMADPERLKAEAFAGFHAAADAGAKTFRPR